MGYESKRVYLREYYSSLDGDVGVSTITTVGEGEHEYTVVDWSHDGKYCVDIYDTENGCVRLNMLVGEASADELFMAVYTATYACMRMEGEIPEGMKEEFIETALE
jgi:hypothetical protein